MHLLQRSEFSQVIQDKENNPISELNQVVPKSMRVHGAKLLDHHYKQFKQTFIEALSCGTDIFK